MRKFALMLLLLFSVSMIGYAQSKTVEGVVISGSNNQPIIGAMVIVEGTTKGAVTGAEGDFAITNVAGAVKLEVSYLGYESQIVAVAAAETRVIITLKPDALAVEEVVVTGLGISKDKKALGYSVQDLKSDDITAAGNPNVITSLQGKVAGVEIKPSSGMPGASSQIVIRGARSFTGDNQPLYVVDGMPISSGSDMSTGNSVTGSDYSNRAMDIDPNDIASMTILKGQAASALYGIRASNGVVVITTKSAAKNGNGRVNVSFSNTTSIETVSRTPDYQTIYAQGSYGVFNPSHSFSWGPEISNLPNDPTYGGNANGHPGMYYVPQIEQGGAGDGWVTPEVYDNFGDFFQKGYTTNTAVSVSQSKDGTNYYIGLNHTEQQGIIGSTGMTRAGARMNADTKLSNSWRSGFSGSFSQNSISKSAGGNDALMATVFGAPSNYNLAGNPTHVLGDPYDQLCYRLTNSFNNPYWAMENNSYAESTSRFFGNTFVEFTPDLGLSKNQSIVVKYQLGVDSYTTNYDTVLEYGTADGRGSIDNTVFTKSTYNSLLTAIYNLDITNDLKFNFMLGNEFNHTNSRSQWAAGQNFNFGGWQHIDNTTTQWGGDLIYQERTLGFFGNMNLEYKNMLYLNVTGRQDVVSTMPEGARSFFYPSVSLGFVFTELPMLKGNQVINFGKLRASYAQVGQADRYYNDYLTTPSYSGGFWNSAPLIYPNNNITSYAPYGRIYDPNMKPQNTTSYEAGLDLRLFSNLIDFSYTYSRQNVKDQIFPVPLPPSSGYSEKIMNGGRIHTNTHELMATFNLIRKSDWRWSVNANWTKMENFVDELAEGVESIMLGGFVTPQVRAQKGTTFPVIYGQTFAKDENGNVLVDEDPNSWSYGMPLAGPMGVIGNVSPNFILGFGSELSWRNLTLRATFDWKNGGQMYSGTNGLMNLYGTSQVSADLRGKEFIYPGYLSNGQPNNIVRGGANDPDAVQDLYTAALDVDEAYIYDSDFVKLRELSLSYRLKAYKSFTVGINMFARNILLWTPLPNLDPEASQGNTNMGGAFERLSLPQASSFGMGINLTF